ncbi:MAG TPA: hypothetical protein VFL83_10965 [Anaeromyxobacter sp.]|nr:hypothetical protein [Anaeromyxobacter sp.]
MTDPHVTQGHAHGGVRSEEDRISTSRIVAVGVGSLVVFFLAGLAASVYLAVRQGEHGPVPIPPEVGRSKIGMVEQQQFDLSVRGERDRAARLERLRSYGWVDRPAGVVHVPIDLAMELVTKGVRAAPGPAVEERPVPGGQP